MSEKKDASKVYRSGTGVLLSGLAVGALLGAPPAAAAEPVVASAGAATQAAPTDAIRDQFSRSFIPGVVAPPDKAEMPIICDPS